MASLDLKNNIENQSAFAPATINTDTTTNGIEIDTQGYESLTFVNRCSSFTDGDYAVLIEETDTTGAGYTAVADNDLIGTEADAALSAAGVSKIGYVGEKRFVRLSFVSTNTTTGATLDSVAVLGNARHNPVS